MHRLALTLLALALLVTACGSGEGFGSTTTPPTTAPAETTAPTTIAPETTTLPPETTSTTVPLVTTTTPAGYYAVDTSEFFPDPFPGSSGGAHGSGCVVQNYEELPDGVFFGFAEGVGGGSVDFDLACYFTGEAALIAAAEDEAEALDFYIRNNVAVTYHVPIAADARVWYIQGTAVELGPIEIPLASWPSPDSFQECPSDHCAVWLYVNGGHVTGIVEQYVS